VTGARGGRRQVWPADAPSRTPRYPRQPCHESPALGHRTHPSAMRRARRTRRSATTSSATTRPSTCRLEERAAALLGRSRPLVAWARCQPRRPDGPPDRGQETIATPRATWSWTRLPATRGRGA